MQGADYLIVAVIAVSVIMGVLRGFVREVVALLTWIVAIWIAWRFSAFLYPYLGGVLVTTAQKAWVARGIMFLAMMILGTLVGVLLSHMTRSAAGLSAIDRLLGLVFGLTRGIIMVGFAAMLGQTLHLEYEPWWTQSKLAPYAVHVAHWLDGVAGESRDFARAALTVSLPPTSIKRV